MTGNINRQLRDAAQEGNLKKVRALLAEGADVNCFSRNDGSTPLLLALAEGHQKVWRHLLDAGARTDVQAQLGATALHVAASAGDTEAIETLVGLGLPLESKDRMGYTPLIEAVESGPEEAVEWLLKHGADPNATDKEGCTSLHSAYFQKEMGEGECDEECERLIALLKTLEDLERLEAEVKRWKQEATKLKARVSELEAELSQLRPAA